jgi:hypothetical protein
MRPAPDLVPVATLTVLPWADPLIDSLGHHPCSSYVENFWLGVLGPSTTFLLRHLVTTLEAAPDGFELPLAVTARRHGRGAQGGRPSPVMRSLARLVQFELAELEDERTLAVRRRVPPLNRRQLIRLPDALQEAHLRWQEQQLKTPPVEHLRRRSRQLALSYLETGLEIEETERHLLRLGYHPALAYESTHWAVERHEQALAAALREPVVAGAAD